MEVSRTKSHTLDALLSKRPSLGSRYMFNMPQRATDYNYHEVHA
jgi:hypothetical protein